MQLPDLLAVYGAALSTGVFFWTIKSNRPSIRVRMVHTYDIAPDDKFYHGVRVQVQNPSLHPAHINSICVYYPYCKRSVIEKIRHIVKYRSIRRNPDWVAVSLSSYGVDHGCPVTIEASSSYGLFIPEIALDAISDSAVEPKFKVMVQDSLWRDKFSKAFQLYQGPKWIKPEDA
jgi:hypothetical protein